MPDNAILDQKKSYLINFEYFYFFVIFVNFQNLPNMTFHLLLSIIVKFRYLTIFYINLHMFKKLVLNIFSINWFREKFDFLFSQWDFLGIFFSSEGFFFSRRNLNLKCVFPGYLRYYIFVIFFSLKKFNVKINNQEFFKLKICSYRLLISINNFILGSRNKEFNRLFQKLLGLKGWIQVWKSNLKLFE